MVETDGFERDLSARLHRWSDGVVPSDGFVERIHAEVDHRRRRRRLLFGAVHLAALLAGAVALGEVLAGGGPAPSFSSGPAVTVRPSTGGAGAASSAPRSSDGLRVGPSSSVPAPSPGAKSSASLAPIPQPFPNGWIPVDLAGARISVPPGSFVSSADCPQATAPVTVFLRTSPTPPDIALCSLPSAGASTVTLSVLPPGTPTAGLTPSTVNGIPVFGSDGGPGSSGRLLIPSLGVQIDASGPQAGVVLGTLTRSPRARVLAGGKWPHVPRGWQRVSFGGVRLSVPPSWPVRHLAVWGPVCQTVPPWGLPGLGDSPPSADLVSGTVAISVACPMLALAPAQPATPPSDGL
ncbi:MAG: hypothetical protein JO085_02780, partial [Acidimicrobiia bacterium]|nr:hypothetical protein [Acidimicrobiia bacterium]